MSTEEKESSKHLVQTRLDDDVYEILCKLAEEDDRSIASFLSRMIKENLISKGYLKEKKKKK